MAINAARPRNGDALGQRRDETLLTGFREGVDGSKPAGTSRGWTLHTPPEDQEASTSTLRSERGHDGAGASAASAFEERFLEASPDCVKLIDLNGRLQFMNANGRRLMELADGALVTMPWRDFWPDAARAAVDAALAEACAGRVARFSAACPTALGTTKWWDVVVSPIAGKDGAVSAILSVSRDVTSQKAIEQTLIDSEQRFRALANNIAQFAWMCDASGYLFWYNSRWFEYTGTTLEDMAGWGWKAVHHPDHVDRVVRRFTASLTSGIEWEDVFPLRAADGTYRWFLSRAMPVRDASGQIALWCGTNTDITEQRNQSQRLRQLARIIELSHEAILVWDATVGIVLWNRGCEELYGYAKTDALGTPSHELLKTSYPVPRAEFERDLLTKGEWSGELRHLARDGSEVWVESRQELIRIDGRDLVLETNRDITERRRADEIRNLLVGELDHRVRNTLAIIQSIAAQTARVTSDVPSFVASFNGRLHALAGAHAVLTEAHWSGAGLRKLVNSQIAIVLGDASRVVLDGQDVFLPPQTALQITLILHELATNAIKHGALSNATGRIRVSWAVLPGEPPKLDLVWRESGGPPVRKPAARGFGTTLIERSGQLPHLQAGVTFEPDGVVVHVVAALQPDHAKSPALFNPGPQLLKRSTTPAGSRLDPPNRTRILLVESDPMHAMQLENVLYDAGYATIGPLYSTEGALKTLADVVADIAILNVDDCATSTMAPLIDELQRRRVPIVVIGSQIPDDTAADPRIEAAVTKPIDPAQLLAAVKTATTDPSKS